MLYCFRIVHRLSYCLLDFSIALIAYFVWLRLLTSPLIVELIVKCVVAYPFLRRTFSAGTERLFTAKLPASL